MKPKHAFYLKFAKGFRGRRKNCYRLAKSAVQKSWQKAYIARRVKRRLMRKSWIGNINAATREQGLSYSTFFHALRRSNIFLNRKMLAELAVHEPYSFKCVVDQARIAAHTKKRFDEERCVRLAPLIKSLEIVLDREKTLSKSKKESGGKF